MKVAAKSNCGCIVMHDGTNAQMKNFFDLQLNKMIENDISQSRICFDPGIGFGKTYEENLYVIKNLKKSNFFYIVFSIFFHKFILAFNRFLWLIFCQNASQDLSVFPLVLLPLLHRHPPNLPRFPQHHPLHQQAQHPPSCRHLPCRYAPAP